MAKQELEFFDPVDIPWRRPDGYPEGVWEKVLAADEENGTWTRLLRWDPGVRVESPVTHETWEEVYIISGWFSVRGTRYSAGMVAVRPPGMVHGPFETPEGCLTFEVTHRG